MPQMGIGRGRNGRPLGSRRSATRLTRDEPLFEISTDKVVPKIPSPSAGTLLEIRVRKGRRCRVDTVVAVLAGQGEVVTAPARPRRCYAQRVPAPPRPWQSSARGLRRLRPLQQRPRPDAQRQPRRPSRTERRGPARPHAAHAVLAPRPAHRAGARRRHHDAGRDGHRRRVTKQGHPEFIDTRALRRARGRTGVRRDE